MALDDRFVLDPQMQILFRDKDTGLPLRSGYLLFWEDKARTVGKQVYELSGVPPNYTYVDLGTLQPSTAYRVDLNSAGYITEQLYFFPFDGTPTSTTNTVDLYFIEIYSSDDVLQGTREAWPNTFADSAAEEVDENFISNGQFLAHEDLPAKGAFEAGEIRQAITDIAYGGWTFERPVASTATDIVTFDRNASYVTNPEDNPRYSIRVNTQVPDGGDLIKDLRIKYNDVNKFASDTDKFTFKMSAQSNTGGNIQVDLVLIKNFGTGGSAPTDLTLNSFIVTPGSYSDYSFSFAFGNNSAKTIGPDDDDFVQLGLRFLRDTGFDVSITDVLLTEGELTAPTFPYTTTRQSISQSLGGSFPIPDYDGFDLYLPIRLGQAGLEYDDTIVGKIFASTQESAQVGELLCDGTKYTTDDCSADGIPYRRLQQKLIQSNNIPLFGTGEGYFTGVYPSAAGVTNTLRIVNNTEGAVGASADVNTGFTLTTIHTGSDYFCKSYLVSNDTFYIDNNDLGVASSFGAGTSGFTVSSVQPGITAVLQEIISVQTIAAAGLAGLYFEFETLNPGAQLWYVWFTVDGAGADPAVGGRTGIQVNLLSTDIADDVASKVREAINGWNSTNVICNAAGTLTTGDYFTVDATLLDYYVWYNVDDGGGDPAPVGRTGIEVAVASTDTDAVVAQTTQIAINDLCFSVPDLRGLFLRGWDNGAGVDPEAALRWSLVPGAFGDVVGSFQNDQVKGHKHQTVTKNNVSGNSDQPVASNGVGGGIDAPTVVGVGQGTGAEGLESRPANMSVNYVIKY